MLSQSILFLAKQASIPRLVFLLSFDSISIAIPLSGGQGNAWDHEVKCSKWQLSQKCGVSKMVTQPILFLAKQLGVRNCVSSLFLLFLSEVSIATWGALSRCEKTILGTVK